MHSSILLTFLGTGTSQGVPVIGCDCVICRSSDPRDLRLRSSVMIESCGKRIVIDCGPDFRQQMLRESVNSIDAILITHAHKDHIGGLDDVRAFNYFLKRPTDIYSTSEIQKAIRRDYFYAFEGDRYPGVPELTLHTITNAPFTAAGIGILPVKAIHYQEQFVFGYRIGDLTYLTDAVSISDEEKVKIKGSKVIIINALRKKVHYSHFNLNQAIELLDSLRPERAFITHISHQMGLHAEVSRELPDYISLAYDRLKVTL